MALLSKDTGGSGFEDLAPGAYVGRCISVIDLGVQQTPFGGKEKVYIGFEVPGERCAWKDKQGVDHEGPALIGSRYTNSIHEKSILGQTLIGWRGKPFTDEERAGFDLFNILGKPCLINVVHTQKDSRTYANIQSIMRLPQGMECGPAESELLAYSPMDQTTAGNFAKLPEWAQKLVRAGYQMAENSNVVGSGAGVPVQPGNAQDARAAALAAAGAQGAPGPAPGNDDWDDDIPF